MLEPVPHEEHLLISTYAEICKELNSPKVVYKNTEEVYDHFVRCDEERLPPHVVVSGACDFSIREQSRFHPNEDLIKFRDFIDWNGFSRQRDRYHGIKIVSCNSENCRPGDKYVAKTDRFSWYTFPELPASVTRWYVTNLDVTHSRMRWLPFGVNNDGDGYVRLREHVGKKKTGTLYVNFSPNTVERLRLAEYFKKQPWATYRENVPNDQYLAEVAEHKAVLSPPGNGLDCYRNYEAIYLQSIPILSSSVFSRNMIAHTLPVWLVNDFVQAVTPFNIDSIYEDYVNRIDYVNYESVTKSYWRSQLAKEA